MKVLTHWITKILSSVLIMLMAAIVLDVTWQVFTRFILQHPSSFTEELARFLLIWIGILGASYALYTKAHLGIDILTYKATGLKKVIIEICVNLFIILFSLFIMVIGGARLVSLTLQLNQISASMGIKMGYIYAILPASGVLNIYFSIQNIVEAIQSPSSQSESHHVSSLD